ncbi:MAG: sigma-E factor negative regulatory protein [Thiomonas sp.]
MSAENPRERLSALIDGEAEFAAPSAQAAAFIRQTASDDALRRDWLLYAQIGDVLRSADLAAMPGEHEFLQRVSAAVAREPVVLRPSAQNGRLAVARATRRPHWSTRMTAVAAAVAGVAVMAWVALPGLQSPSSSGGSVRPVIAARVDDTAAAGAQIPVVAVRANRAAMQMAQGSLVQTELTAPGGQNGGQIIPVSAQMPMVEYLLAHQQMAGGMMPAVPATLRVVVQRPEPAAAQAH